MTPGSFRQLVKDEVRIFLENNQRPLSRLLGILADQVGPAIADEISKGVLRQTGQLEPTERQKVSDVLQEARDFISRYGLARKDTTPDADWLLNLIDTTRIEVISPAKPPANGDSLATLHGGN